MYGFKVMNLDAMVVTSSGRKIGFGALSLLAGFYCAEPCAAALLHVMGAVSAARLASSTLLILVVAATSLGWALWRLYRSRRACAGNSCLSTRAVWFTAILAIVTFAVDVVS